MIGRPPGPRGRAMKILVAEDDSVSRLLLESILREWGYDVAATTNGLAA